MNLNQIYENKILVGIATITATIILLGWISINENARMEEFTERAEGRSIENGARLFEANCAPCHGYDGRGVAGRAPALNNPHLFGYDFRGEIPGEITALEVSIERATDAGEKAALEVQLAQLEAEQTVIVETVLYDWSEMVAPSSNDVCEGMTGEVDPAQGYSERQACELGQLGIDLMLFDRRISQRLEGAYEDQQLLDLLEPRERDQLAPLLAQRAELLAIENRTPEQEAELNEVRAQIGEILAFQLPILVGKMQTQMLAPLQTEQADLEARRDSETGLTAEEEERLAQLLDVEIPAVDALISPLETLANDRATIQAKQGRFQALIDAHEEVKRLRDELAVAASALDVLPAAPEDDAPDPNATERESLTTAVETAQTALDEAIAARDTAYTALLDAGEILDYRFIFDDNPDAPQHARLLQVEWSGTLFDFVEGTLVGGRPPSAGYWPQPMAAWSQRSGGPLRDDQVQNLVRYILNWNRKFTVADLRAVRQFAVVPGVGGGAVEGAIGADVELAAQTYSDLIAGGFVPDAQAGAQLFQTLACQGCHVPAGGGTGPSLRGVFDRAVNNEENRLTDTGHEDQPDLYVFESILQPEAFTVPGFPAGIMPPNFGERLTPEEFANLIEYLREQ